MTFRRVIFIILTIAWMGMIFWFSSKPSEESSSQSTQVSMILGNILYKDFGNWSKAEQLLFTEKTANAVRKTAHAVEFAILALLLFETAEGPGGNAESPGTTKGPGTAESPGTAENSGTADGPGTTKIPGTAESSETGMKKAHLPLKAAAIAELITALYACSDEFHQKFVSGRSPQIGDVVIDSLGGLIMMGVVILVRYLKKCKHSHLESKH